MSLERTREQREERFDPDARHAFDLAEVTRELRGESAYGEHGRNGVTLVKRPRLRVLLEAIRAGAGLAEHTAPGPITVHVLEGELRFVAGGETHELSAGSLLSVPAGQPHAVEATRDCAFLVTLVLEPAAGAEPA